MNILVLNVASVLDRRGKEINAEVETVDQELLLEYLTQVGGFRIRKKVRDLIRNHHKLQDLHLNPQAMSPYLSSCLSRTVITYDASKFPTCISYNYI